MLGDPHPTDSTRTSFASQITSAFKHPAKKELYIALADRWLPRFDTAYSQATADAFEQYFAQAHAGPIEIPGVTDRPDTANADYFWLPVRFDGGMAYLDWRDEWRIEECN